MASSQHAETKKQEKLKLNEETNSNRTKFKPWTFVNAIFKSLILLLFLKKDSRIILRLILAFFMLIEIIFWNFNIDSYTYSREKSK